MNRYVKILAADNPYELDARINKFLKDAKGNLVNAQYTMGNVKDGYRCSALLIMEDTDETK